MTTFTAESFNGHAPSVGFRLAELEAGTPVTLTQDGRDIACEVQRWSRDGSIDHARLTVGLGPGRWNTDVTAAGIIAGHYSMTVV